MFVIARKKAIVISATLFTLTLLCLFLPAKKSYSFDGDDRKMSLFVYKLAQYINNQGQFCIYGQDGVTNNLDLNKIKTTTLLDAGNDAAIKNCKLVYIAQSEEKHLKILVDKFNRQGLTTIGLMDSFIEDNGTMSVEIGRRGGIELSLNEGNIKKYNIKLNPIILNITTNRKKNSK
jgi:hypothetical protein